MNTTIRKSLLLASAGFAITGLPVTNGVAFTDPWLCCRQTVEVTWTHFTA